jgi:hypothetical protein
VSQQHAVTSAPVVPQVVASYATYLRARTHTEPEATIAGDHAELAVGTGQKTLVLAFDCHH